MIRDKLCQKQKVEPPKNPAKFLFAWINGNISGDLDLLDVLDFLCK